MGVMPIALALAGPATLPGPVVDLRDAAIRLGDVVRGADSRVAATVIARLPEGRRGITLSRRALTSLVRRALPGFAPQHLLPSGVTFRRGAAPARTGCFVARAPIGAGTRVTGDLVRRGPCATNAAATRYVRGVIVAAAPIEAGGPVGSALSPPEPAVGERERLTLVARSGSVTVERDVVALQAGRRGGKLFVRDMDGRVFAAPLVEGAR